MVHLCTFTSHDSRLGHFLTRIDFELVTYSPKLLDIYKNVLSLTALHVEELRGDLITWTIDPVHESFIAETREEKLVATQMIRIRTEGIVKMRNEGVRT